jgi:hypothetical protein
MVKPLEWVDYMTSTEGSQCGTADNGDRYFVHHLSPWSDAGWHLYYRAEPDWTDVQVRSPASGTGSFTSAEEAKQAAEEHHARTHRAALWAVYMADNDPPTT